MVLESRENNCFILYMLSRILGLMAIRSEMQQLASLMANFFNIQCQIYFKKHCSSLPVLPIQICQFKYWHWYKHFTIVGSDNGKALCSLSCLLNACATQYCYPGCHFPPKGIFYFFLKCQTHTKNLAQKEYSLSTALLFLFVRDKKSS